jgi:hypothetical protein
MQMPKSGGGRQFSGAALRCALYRFLLLLELERVKLQKAAVISEPRCDLAGRSTGFEQRCPLIGESISQRR